MTVPIIAFFNNKGGVGKTTLVYHLSWMYSEIGYSILVADLDPQANLTAAFLDEDRLFDLWSDDKSLTIYGGLKPLLSGTGDIVAHPHCEKIDENLHLLVGDLSLSQFEDELSLQWAQCLDKKERAFRVISAFWRMLQRAASDTEAKLILIDLGPNLGSLNRAALVASDYLVIPLASDLFSLQGLRNLGPMLWTWREEWRERLTKNPVNNLALPPGKIKPLGYVLMQHAVRLDRPVHAYERWAAKIPDVYSKDVIRTNLTSASNKKDINRIGLVKHYRSLMPMAQEARKPMFYLKSADGAIGTHAKAVTEAWENFNIVAKEIIVRILQDNPSIHLK